MSQQGELQGFINVKIPSRMKSRSFMPWKTWKRQWVVVRRSRSTRNGVELLIGRNSPTILPIPADAVICRTESRTQHYAFGVFPDESKRRANVYLSGTSETDSHKWIGKIRKLLKPALLPVEDNEFSVSVIDNFFTRSAGLSALYGTLTVSPDQVAIVDPFTSKTKAQWPWTTLAHFHVASTTAPEDRGRICTIVTSRAFPTGVGQIHLYCPEGVALADKLAARGRPTSPGASAGRRLATPVRHHTFSCNSPEKPSRAPPAAPQPAPRASCLGRRLSRSEGNLLCALGLYGFLEGRGECDSEDKASSDSSECFLGKVKVCVRRGEEGSELCGECGDVGWCGQAGEGRECGSVGLLWGTPGGSEGDESLHEYQRLEKGDSDDDDDIGLLSFSIATGRFSPPRRESGVSLASGVYEEIEQFSLPPTASHSANSESESPPPPLPPRREAPTRSDEGGYANSLRVPTTVKRFLSRSAGSTPAASPPCMGKWQTVSAEGLAPRGGPWDARADGDYLPMLPGCGLLRGGLKAELAPKEGLEEQHYMVMASTKGS